MQKNRKDRQDFNGGDAGNHGNKEKQKSGEIDSEIEETLSQGIVIETPDVHWEDVVGLERAKDALKEAIILPIKFPHLFIDARKPWPGILLYGSPGTGKSSLAKAVATEAKNATFITISSLERLEESEKVVKNLFDLAREHKPSIILFDEVDVLLGLRRTYESQSESIRRIRTEFMVQMHDVGNSNDGISILATTNTPWELDPAIRRRFNRRIHIPLPDAQTRTTMFKYYLRTTPYSVQEEEFHQLGLRTDRFSGADINDMVKDALIQSALKVQSATHFKRVQGPCREDPMVIVDDLLTPCSPEDVDAIEMSWTSIASDKLLEPMISMNDLMMLLTSFKPSVNDEDLQKLKQFTEDFGQEGY